MATQVQNRRGTTAEHSTFTGANGELTVDTTKRTLVVHDGATAGGRPLLREDQSNLPTSAPTTGIYNTSGSLAISTGGSGRLFVDASGRLGVGTSSPSTTLEIQNSTTPRLRIGDGIRHFEIHGGSSTQNVALGTAYNSGFDFFINGLTNPKMTLDASGRLGIGTTSPQELLHVNTGSSGGQVLRMSTNGADTGYLYQNSGAVVLGAYSTRILGFETNGSERARIDSSGRLLVGTSSSITNALEGGVQIVGTAADAYLTLTRFGGATASAPAGIILGRSRSGTKGTNTAVSDGDFLGVVEFTGADGGSSYRSAAQIGAYVDGVVSGGGAADMPGRLVFSTTADGASSPTERMRISKGGEVSIGSNIVSGTPLSVRDSSGGSAVIRSDSTTAQGTDWYLFYGTSNSGTTLQGWLRGDGTYGSRPNVYGGTSDAKLKENIVDSSSQWDDIKAIQVKKFNFIGDDLCQIGVIAQQVEEVSPGLVDENVDRDEDGNDLGTVTKSVKYSVLYMKAVKALQEAMERIEVLEQRLTDAGIA